MRTGWQPHARKNGGKKETRTGSGRGKAKGKRASLARCGRGLTWGNRERQKPQSEGEREAKPGAMGSCARGRERREGGVWTGKARGAMMGK